MHVIIFLMKKTVQNKLLRYFLIMVGTFLLAVSVEMFIIPYNILSGGVAGIAVAIEPFTHINKTLMANILVIGLLIAGSIFLGKEFVFETAFSSLLYPVFTTSLERIIVVPQVDVILASFYGGLIAGIGIGMVLRVGASTGGMDIPPLIIHKFTNIPLSTLILIIDGATVLIGYFAYGLPAVLVGLISVFTCSFGVNKVFSIGSGVESKSVQIISDHWEAILKDIDERLHRGATLIDGYGSFKGSKRKIILCAVSQKQYATLSSIIQANDPHAFVITTDATDMHGQGFSDIARI